MRKAYNNTKKKNREKNILMYAEDVKVHASWVWDAFLTYLLLYETRKLRSLNLG